VIELNCKKRRGRPRRPVWRSLAVAFAPVAAAILSMQGVANASDTAEVEIRVKAAFIYNFARFVEWPRRGVTQSVRIGIIGSGDLALPLEVAIRGKWVNGRLIELTHVNTLTEVDCCDILLIERSASNRVREIVHVLAGRPVLTVFDGESGFRDGVMIAFQLIDETVRFQINQEAAERAGLKISSQLLKVALAGPEKRR